MTAPADPFDRGTRPEPGRIDAVAPGVRRIVAENPSPMTFTGTCSYILGEREVAILDPGPDDAAHQERLLEAIGPEAHVAAVLVTHSHLDHSGGARRLARLTGAPTLGFGRHGAGMSDRMRALAEAELRLGGGEGADATFEPDRPLADGDALAVEGRRLVALHTPGHLSNHLCFALEGEGVVFSGDHVMAWATTLVSPPDGDMTAFLASLRRLKGRGDRLFLPGHGGPVRDPEHMIDAQLAHRAGRERAIFDALAEGPADTERLVARIYGDLDATLRPAARRNVLAHLLALLERGAVVPRGLLSADAAFALAG
mgnify:FL=1